MKNFDMAIFLSDAMGNITNVSNAVLNESKEGYNTGTSAEIYYDYNNVTKRLD